MKERYEPSSKNYIETIKDLYEGQSRVIDGIQNLYESGKLSKKEYLDTIKLFKEKV